MGQVAPEVSLKYEVRVRLPDLSGRKAQLQVVCLAAKEAAQIEVTCKVVLRRDQDELQQVPSGHYLHSVFFHQPQPEHLLVLWQGKQRCLADAVLRAEVAPDVHQVAGCNLAVAVVYEHQLVASDLASHGLLVAGQLLAFAGFLGQVGPLAALELLKAVAVAGELQSVVIG